MALAEIYSQALCPARVPVGQVVCPTHGVQLHPTGTEGVAMTGTPVVTLHPHSARGTNNT